MSASRNLIGGVSTTVRGCFGGGRTPSASNVIDYITIASTGNATDFGDLTSARLNPGSMSNNLTGLFAGGATPSVSDIIDFITIASTGNATDFGDIAEGNTGPSKGTGSDSHSGLQSA